MECWKHSSPRTDLSGEKDGSFGRFFWARNALYYALSALKITPGAHVLLPAYLCSAAVEPFRYYGVNIEFYDIGLDCEPDLSEIVSKINSRTEAILMVHYFGFPQQSEKFRAICDHHNLALIEDCAHVLRHEENTLGLCGDASIFSWRKFLPVYDGGELHLSHNGARLNIDYRRETAVFTAKVAKSLVDRTLEESDGAFASAVQWLLKSGVNFVKYFQRSQPGRPLVALDSNDAAFDASLINQPMSRVSRLLLRHADLRTIAMRRRENFAALHERLSTLDGVLPLHTRLPGDVCPWVYPLTIQGVEDAHLLLRKQGIPAANWDGVRPIGMDPKAFSCADFLYRNLLFLPVHQNLTRNGIELITEKVRSIRRTTPIRSSSETCIHG